MSKRDNHAPAPAHDRLLARQAVIKQTLTISAATEWRRRRDDPNFPRPIRVASGRLFYRQSDLDRYIASLTPEKAA